MSGETNTSAAPSATPVRRARHVSQDASKLIVFFGGYQFHKHIAVELGYGMLFDKNSVEVTTMEAVAVGIFPLNNQFSIIGKLGLANVEAEGPGGSEDKTELTYGIGVQWDFTRNLGARAQWQRYDTDDAVDYLSIGIVWRF